MTSSLDRDELFTAARSAGRGTMGRLATWVRGIPRARFQIPKQVTWHDVRPSDVDDLERTQAVALPSDYRMFLTQVGIDGRYVMSLEDWGPDPGADWLEPTEHLHAPFPHAHAWNEPEHPDAPGGYRDHHHTRGTIRLANLGCELYYLLVVTGPERGNLWADLRADRAGIAPLASPGGGRLNFLGYLNILLGAQGRRGLPLLPQRSP